MIVPCQYIVLHTSTKKYPGVAASQATHAATESLRKLPVSDQTHACVLEAETSQQIEELAVALRKASIHHVVIREPDAPYNGAAVALGVEPQAKENVKPFMVSFKVFR